MKFWPFNNKSESPENVKAEPVENPKGFTAVAKDGFTTSMELQRRHDAAMKKSFLRTHADLQIVTAGGTAVAMDSQMKEVMDNNIQQVKSFAASNQGFLPIHVLEWFSNQGFIGWQVCAILAQNWLVNKACKMPGQDAVRHGFERTVNKDVEVPPDAFDKLRALDKRYKLKNNLIEHYKFARVFGIRHTLFLVDGIDYELPFNIDGVKEGSYKGMTQIDPYWLAPMFDLDDASNPQSQNFYNPTWWMINGKKFHRSHFVISRNGNDLADILKPSYFYGGLSTAQLIYERVYAAERTANEAPLLAMTKRLLTLTTDTTKAMNNLEVFKAKLTEWMALINNFGLKVLGPDEKVDQIDTSLAEFNETIMTQYGLVAAEAEVPEAKLLGKSPKGGLGSEGTYDSDSYHEFLESVQELELSPIVERHTQLCQRSHGISPTVNIEIIWNPTDSPTAKELAEINKIKADTDVALTTAGSIDGVDSRKRLIADKDSGYNGIEEIDEPFDPAAEEGEPEGGGDGDGGTAEDGYLCGDFDAAAGTFQGARLITHQRYLDEKKVAEKIKNGDFVVNVTPEFVDQGKLYRMIVDGHHSLAAAVRTGNAPIFTTDLPREVVFNAATRKATDGADKVTTSPTHTRRTPDPQLVRSPDQGESDDT
jgi:phage-related protein (TIGR01555 family)